MSISRVVSKSIFFVRLIVEPSSTISTRLTKSVARTFCPLTLNFSTPSSSAPAWVGSKLNEPLVIGDVLSVSIVEIELWSRSSVGTTTSVSMSSIAAVVLIFDSLTTSLISAALSLAAKIALFVVKFEPETTMFECSPLTTNNEPTDAEFPALYLLPCWIVSTVEFSSLIEALSSRVSATTAVAETSTLLNESSASSPSTAIPVLVKR